MKRSVLVAMSGGVDSAVAALLLKEAGHDVVGATMCLGVDGGPGGRAICCGADAVQDARAVCDRIGIAHHVFDYAAEFQERVIGRFAAEHARGRTPNPCVDCNRFLKFGSLLEKALALGFDGFATGHYAGIETREGAHRLTRGSDPAKDQSYFLYALPRARLGRIIFPLAALRKSEVRELAARAGLRVARKPESQDLCFASRAGLREVLARRRVPSAPGPIVDESGRVLGSHKGLVEFTIGQRVGLRCCGGERRYAVRKDLATGTLVVGRRHDLLSAGLVAGDANWLCEPRPGRAEARIRFRGAPVPCRIVPEDDEVTVLFDEPQSAVCPGQFVVLYRGSVVLGGGAIDRAVDRGWPPA